MPLIDFRLLACAMSLLTLFSSTAAASAALNAKQDPRLIQETVLGFLHTQSAGLPGEVEIKPGIIDARVNLPSCAVLEPSLPPGSRPWGNTTVVVRCTSPHPWTIYVRATVKVIADYVVSARPLTSGHILHATDLTLQRGDLTQLPAGIITDLNQAMGKTLTGNLPFGSLLRQDMLRAKAAVMHNQSVKLVSSGRGFSVSAEGKALNNAIDGQLVQVRVASGSVVSGIARAGAIVEVNY
ncbi:MAG: flagellar basal body P-ring formation protein FlgA [Nitrosospira sp.]|nr:flagellar basal body P-ring formation protein FlgA [Nitrosospira sp.]